MHRHNIQRHTETVNRLLNQSEILLPVGHQFRWANEQDSLEELWLICSSFIADINAALINTDPIKRFTRLESQMNYGGILVDGQPTLSISIRLNHHAITDEWLIRLRDILGAIYVQVCPFCSHHDALLFHPEGNALSSFSLTLIANQIKMLLQLPELTPWFKAYAYRYSSMIAEHGAWVASISLLISLEKLRCNAAHNRHDIAAPLTNNLLITHIDSIQVLLKRLDMLTSPFLVIDGRITTNFESQLNQDYSVQS
ncbi:hypothetical protein [Vibrio hyugaensis]|uniref:hypothetical protein n=1 Tax=Vibrio hyugaensis TaxID=1534743 RepID=UPI0005F0A1BD|nr:hypothetical protein [Vibrio hyugaensis]